MGGTMGLRLTTGRARRALDLRMLGVLVPIAVGFVLLVALVVLLRGVGLLGSWTEIYGPTGRFTIESCSSDTGQLGAARIECTGQLAPTEGAEVASTLIGPKASFGSVLPPAGAIVDAYYRSGDTSQSFPEEGKPTELARVIAGIIPLLFIVGGLASWLLGWILTRGTSRDEAERHIEQVRWPRRFLLRPRGIAWALVGFAWFAVDRYLVGDLLGVAGLG